MWGLLFILAILAYKGFPGNTTLDHGNLCRGGLYLSVDPPLIIPYGGMLTLPSGIQTALFHILFKIIYTRLKRSTSFPLFLSQGNVPIVVTSVVSSSPSSTLSSVTIGSTRERSHSCVMHVEGHLLTSPPSGGTPQ